jgi:DNA-binding MarR family transcriptional regulator
MTQPGQTTLQRSLSASETDTEAAAEQILLVAARIDHRVDYEVLRPIGLTTRGWRALDAIASHRGLNPSAIAAVAYIRKASLTDILNRLEAMG